jgi:predicted YcjX-like family ATPase
VPERQRDALAALLSGLVGAPADAAGNLTAMPVAALRCTEDDVVTLGGPLGLGGRTVAAVRGVLPNGKLARVYPGEVPLRPPGAEFWTHELFQMPAFQPPRLNAEGRDGLPHLELDRLLAWLIGDLL